MPAKFGAVWPREGKKRRAAGLQGRWRRSVLANLLPDDHAEVPTHTDVLYQRFDDVLYFTCSKGERGVPNGACKPQHTLGAESRFPQNTVGGVPSKRVPPEEGNNFRRFFSVGAARDNPLALKTARHARCVRGCTPAGRDVCLAARLAGRRRPSVPKRARSEAPQAAALPS